MDDQNMVKIMESLGLDYSSAILSTKHFEGSIQSLNKELQGMKGIAIQTAKDVGNAFSNTLGTSVGNKTIVDQYGNAFKTAQTEAKKANSTLREQATIIKQSTLEQMKSQVASVQQRVTTKGLSQEYGKQAVSLREQLAVIQARLQAEGRLTAEEVRQTQQLKEQLDILKAQTRTDISDDIRMNPSTFSDEWQRRSSWFLTGTMFYGAINAAKETQETIKDVEMGMVEIARVMTDSSFVFKDYRDNLMQLGIEYGQTFENVQQIALRWAQSGYNVADSLELTKTSLLALNTAELDATQATESMIGIMAQWELQAKDMALVMDKINLTADRYSITSQDLVDGLLRSSGAARIMNVSLDETVGLLTIMREASGRTGREVGNALNSIFSYIQRPTAINTFERMGINVFADEAGTQFRNAMDIFQDIAANWRSTSDEIKDGFVAAADDAELFNEELAVALGMQEEWNSLQQRDIAQASAGVHRRNYFIGMINRMSNIQGVLNNLLEAEGHSMRENAKTMESLEKKQESLKASAEALAVAIGDAGLTSVLKAVADGGISALNAINNLDDGTKNFILSALTTFTAVKTLQLGMKTFGIQLPQLSLMISSLTNGVEGLKLGLMYAKDGMKAFVATNKELLILSAVIGFIVATTNAYKKYREEQEKAIELFNQQRNIHSEASNLIETYKDLADSTSLTAEENAKLAETKQKIIDLLPESKNALDNENLSLQEQMDIIESLNEQELERLKLQAQKQLNRGKDAYEQDKQNLETANEMLELYNKQWAEYSKKQLDGTATKKELDGLKLVTEGIERATKAKNESIANIEAYDSAISIMSGIIKDNTSVINDNANSTVNATKATESWISTIKNTLSELKLLNQAIHDVEKGQSLSIDTVLDLVEKYGLSLDAVTETTNGYKVEKSALEELRNIKIQAAKDSIDAEHEHAIAVRDQVAARLKNYGLEIEQISNLASAKASLARQAATEATGGWSDGGLYTSIYSSVMGELARLEASEKAIEDIARRSKLLEGMLSNPSYGVSSSSSSSAKTGNAALDEALKVLDYKRHINELTLEDEIKMLYEIKANHVNTADELMNINKRIYDAEKRFLDEKVKANEEFYRQEESSIQHLAKLGVYSVQQQIVAYKELYSVKAESLADEQKRVENLFNLYKQMLSDEQSAIKDAYSERMDLIDEEAKRKKQGLEDEKKAIQEQLDLLDKKDSERSYEQTMQKLQDDLAYWQVRTGRAASEKVIEIQKQIEEEKYKYNLEQQKQKLNDKIDALDDEIDEVERAAKEEKEKWEKSYKQVEKAFDTHSTNIVALAGAMSKEAYQQWVDNYLVPLQNALKSGDLDTFSGGSSGLGGSIDDLKSNYSGKNYVLVNPDGTSNAKAGDIVVTGGGLYRKNADGSSTKIGDLSGGSTSDYSKVIEEYNKLIPKFHDGGKALTDGMAIVKKQEMVLTPELSLRMDSLLDFLRGNTIFNRNSTSNAYDNRKEVRIDKLVNIENNRMEDDGGIDIFARQINRMVKSIL